MRGRILLVSTTVIVGTLGTAFYLAQTDTAASSELPACSDERVISIVKRVAAEKIGLRFLLLNATSDGLSVEAIRTRPDAGARRQCAAALVINTAPKLGPVHEAARVEITYTIQLTDNDQFYVTVRGL